MPRQRAACRFVSRCPTFRDVDEAVSDHWTMSFWNPTTGEYKETVDDLVIPKDRPVSSEDSAGPTEQ
jgi:hypothetical protein